MINPTKLNRFSGRPVGYKLVAPPTQLGLAARDSMHGIRGEFVDNHVHVTKHSEKEMYAAGEHNWQSVGGQVSSGDDFDLPSAHAVFLTGRSRNMGPTRTTSHRGGHACSLVHARLHP